MSIIRAPSHKTYINLADDICRTIVPRLPAVTKIAAGVIAPAGPAPPFVKIRDASPGCVLLTVRGATAVQEVWMYSRDTKADKLMLARQLRDRRIPIRFT